MTNFCWQFSGILVSGPLPSPSREHPFKSRLRSNWCRGSMPSPPSLSASAWLSHPEFLPILRPMPLPTPGRLLTEAWHHSSVLQRRRKQAAYFRWGACVIWIHNDFFVWLIPPSHAGKGQMNEAAVPGGPSTRAAIAEEWSEQAAWCWFSQEERCLPASLSPIGEGTRGRGLCGPLHVHTGKGQKPHCCWFSILESPLPSAQGSGAQSLKPTAWAPSYGPTSSTYLDSTLTVRV